MAMSKMEITAVLKDHLLWLDGDPAGIRADLSGKKSIGVNLRLANLRNANLRGTDMRCAFLSGIDLYNADLSGADLSGASLSGADLSGAELSGTAPTGHRNISRYSMSTELS